MAAEEDQLLELLITLIEKFESENYSLGKLSNPLSRLKFLLEQNPLTESDIIELFGAKTNLYNLVNGHIEISQELAIKLGKRFKIDPLIFTTNIMNN
jgi:HTH-type transcriptional regulator / antitoxin HigA